MILDSEFIEHSTAMSGPSRRIHQQMLEISSEDANHKDSITGLDEHDPSAVGVAAYFFSVRFDMCRVLVGRPVLRTAIKKQG